MAMATCDACGATVQIGWTTDGLPVMLDMDGDPTGSFLLVGGVAVGFTVKDLLGPTEHGSPGRWLRPHRLSCGARSGHAEGAAAPAGEDPPAFPQAG